MKKMIFSLAAVGLLASCSQNEIQEMTEKSNEIKFSTLNDKVTRAANDGGSNYRVFAKLTGTGTATAWFMNEEMQPGTEGNPSNGFENFTGGDVIVSKNKFYWPSNTGWTLNFYGFAPHDAAGANYNPSVTDGILPITYTVKTHDTEPDAQEDFTIAIPQSFTDITKPTGNNVHFQFKHMLTKISIDVKLTDALKEAGYSVSYLNSGTPSLTVMDVKATIDATANNPVWDNPLTGNGEAFGDDNQYPTTYEGSSTYLILPQEAIFTKIGMPIVITKDGVVVFEGDVTYQIKLGDITTGNNFLPGKNYGMNITITELSTDNGSDTGNPIFGPEITFSSEVANWDEVTIEKPQPGKPANN